MQYLLLCAESIGGIEFASSAGHTFIGMGTLERS
jgi:hypothetical protein